MSRLTIITDLGEFTISLHTHKAPITSAYFAEIASSGGFDGSSIFRIVNSQNTEIRNNAKIEVIQLGINDLNSTYSKSLKHESTKVTGLQHKKWVVSAARYDVGQNYPSFFICMRDEPELDYGGKRHPDGNGFAAFGLVTEGFKIVEAIFAKAEQTEYLDQALKIISIENKT